MLTHALWGGPVFPRSSTTPSNGTRENGKRWSQSPPSVRIMLDKGTQLKSSLLNLNTTQLISCLDRASHCCRGAGAGGAEMFKYRRCTH